VSVFSTIKKAIWVSVGTALIGSIFWAGVLWNRESNNKERIDYIEKNMVTTKLYEQRDKKMEEHTVVLSSIQESIQELKREVIKSTKDCQKDIGIISTRVAVLSNRQDTDELNINKLYYELGKIEINKMERGK
jgi:hypothetical protein